MTAFKISELVTLDVASFDVGQFFMDAQPRAGSSHSIGVRCAGYDNPPLQTILMMTPDGLTLHGFRNNQPSGLMALKLDISDVRFELSPASPAVLSDGTAAGLLLINESGAYLSVMYGDPRFTTREVVYLNLSDWTQSPYSPRAAGGFSEWKLVATQSGERVLIFDNSQGRVS